MGSESEAAFGMIGGAGGVEVPGLVGEGERLESGVVAPPDIPEFAEERLGYGILGLGIAVEEAGDSEQAGLEDENGLGMVGQVIKQGGELFSDLAHRPGVVAIAEG